eukprot:GGOE01042813.1.p1 GENE.GGOE01042813.1~~GGOE01042813.1.p1  ORF type:complete len:161 (-),score=21.19 GGOE01042813.1:224-706(-)
MAEDGFDEFGRSGPLACASGPTLRGLLSCHTHNTDHTHHTQHTHTQHGTRLAQQTTHNTHNALAHTHEANHAHRMPARPTQHTKHSKQHATAHHTLSFAKRLPLQDLRECLSSMDDSAQYETLGTKVMLSNMCSHNQQRSSGTKMRYVNASKAAMMQNFS